MSGVVVVVDEVRVRATGSGSEHWHYWRRAQHPDRLRVIAASLVGDIVEVACDDREHAGWLVWFLTSQGVPSSALRVARRWPGRVVA